MDKTFGDWLFADIHSNKYLNGLYVRLISEYTKKLLGMGFELTEKEACDLLTFADILSKSTSNENMDFHKNVAQNITTIIRKMYPHSFNNEYYYGSVLSNVQNYVGLHHQCPNYQNVDFIDSVYETVCQEVHKVPFHNDNSPLYFNHSQKIAFETMNKSSMYSFSGPTSMGKTFLIKSFIRSLIEEGNKCNFVIIVPSKALINEIKNDFIKDLNVLLNEKSYKVITTPSAITDEKHNYIMIYTQERYLIQLKENPSMIIVYLFIDEAQKISEVGLRSGYFYKIAEQTFQLFPKIRLYFSCPNIPNPELYFELIPSNVKVTTHKNAFKFSPVNQHKCVYDSDSGELNIYNDLSMKFIPIKYKNNQSLLSLLETIGKDSNNIVFLDSKSDVVDYAVKYSEHCENVLDYINDENKKELLELINDIKNEIHPKCFLVDLLCKGICYHVGYLPATIKEKIEKLYKDKIIKTVFCTSTLLEGVNLPADNLFIGVKKTSYILKNPANFRNLIGRVGRKTYNLVGNVFAIPITFDKVNDVVKNCEELISSPIEPQSLSIESALNEKTKEKIINTLLVGSTVLDKGKLKLSYDKLDLARFCLNILLNNIKSQNYTGTVFRAFKHLLDDNNISIIRDKFSMVEIASDDSKVTNDQINDLSADIQSGLISYPTTINHKNILSFLDRLFEYFNWEKYESKNSIGKKSRLTFFSLLMNKWMNGESVSQIINESIRYYKDEGKIYNENTKETEDFTQSAEQINRIIVNNLTDIEDILLFEISNYFIKFSNLYKQIKNLKVLPNDWSEYLDFGTCDDRIIYLQKIGFSRETAKILINDCRYVTYKNGAIQINNLAFDNENLRMRDELRIVKINYPEFFFDEK